MKVAVIGASGVIGTALVAELAELHDIVAISRNPRPGRAGIQSVRADVTHRETVVEALRGADVVYHLVHSLAVPDFEEADRRAAAIVASAAAEVGARQIIYLGGLGDDSPELSRHLRSRHETAAVLAAGTVPVTTLRAAMVIGPGSAAFETIRALVDRLPAMICPRWVSTPTQPIALRDVVRCLAGVCGLETSFGETYDVGGPEVMTYREMIERIARIRGRHPLIIEVPVLTPRVSSWWLQLVTPVNAAVARPLVEGLRNPTVAHDERIRDLLPFALTPFDEAVREVLAAG